MWVRPILKENERATKGHVSLLKDLLKTDSEEKFHNFIRFTKAEFLQLLNLVGHLIKKQDSNFRKAITPELKLALTLRHLATGVSMTTLHYEFRVGISTAFGIIKDTLSALIEVLCPLYLQEPQSEKFLEISNSFKLKASLPHCIGALDGKHVRIQCPNNSGSEYYNYKRYFSLVLLASCDANYKFNFVDVGAYGSESDGGVFSRSDFGKGLQNGNIHLPSSVPLPGTQDNFPYFFVADEAFPLSEHIMRPFPGNRLTEGKKIFNYRISSARILIENTFGILIQRFRIFRTEIISQPEKVKQIVIAAVCLHNFIVSSRGIPQETQESHYPRNPHVSGGFSEMTRVGSNNSSRHNQDQRNKLMEYFLSDAGSVPWQQEKALRRSF